MEQGPLGSATTMAPTANMWQPEMVWAAPARATSSGKGQEDTADANDRESPTSIHWSPLFPLPRGKDAALLHISGGEAEDRRLSIGLPRRLCGSESARPCRPPRVISLVPEGPTDPAAS